MSTVQAAFYPGGEPDEQSTGEYNYRKVPVRVDIVNIDGLGRTKDDFVERNIQDVFKAHNFEDLMIKTAEIRTRLEKLGCFRNVGIMIDTNKRKGASPHGYEVTFKVTEFRRFVGGVNTTIGANEGAVIFGFKLPNIFGRGERINFDHTIGTVHNKASSVSFMKPFCGPWNAEVLASLIHQSLPNSFSNYNLKSTGGVFDFSFESAYKVKHNMQWEGTWRELEASSRATSFDVRQQSGHSFKSALRHILTIDHRDDHLYPTTGVLLKLVQEYAGLGGDVAFVKHDSEVQVNIPLPFDLIVQGAFKLGVLRPLDPRVQAYNIHDLFFLGGPCGPTTLRGFDMRSVGSRSENDFIGGQAYWSSALHLYGPLPFNVGKGSWGDYFKTHAFINAGNITDNSMRTEDFGQSVQALLTNFRAAYGFGMVFRLGIAAKIELNYCFPIRFSKGDKLIPGIQVGVGVEFL